MQDYKPSFNSNSLPATPRSRFEQYTINFSNGVDEIQDHIKYADAHVEALNILGKDKLTPTNAVEELKDRKFAAVQKLTQIKIRASEFQIARKELSNLLIPPTNEQRGL